MAYKYIIYEPAYRPMIARITLNRPEKLNALSQELLFELFEALQEAEPNDEVSVIIIRGAGRAFCPGYDISPPAPGAAAPGRRDAGTVGNLKWLRWRATRWLSLFAYPKITIAQVHTYCTSGGNELAGNCDFIIASEGTIFGHPAARALGNMPNSYGSIWPATMGLRRAKEFAVSGKPFTAEQAERWGYINKVVPLENLEEEVNAFADLYAKIDPDFLTLHKFAINGYYESNFRSSILNVAQLDSLMHHSSGSQRITKEFGRIREERGLKAALNWRDGRFGDYGTTAAAQTARATRTGKPKGT